MSDDNIEYGVCSRNWDLTTFTNAPFNPFVAMQQHTELVGVMMSIVQGCTGTLRAEAEPWEPIPMIKNNEDQEPTTKEKSHTTKRMDDTNGWTTSNNNTQMSYCNNKME